MDTNTTPVDKALASGGDAKIAGAQADPKKLRNLPSRQHHLKMRNPTRSLIRVINQSQTRTNQRKKRLKPQLQIRQERVKEEERVQAKIRVRRSL